MPISDPGLGWTVAAAGREWSWWGFLENINAKIGSVTDSEDKKMGYFFARPSGGGRSITAATFAGKVAFYLWHDVFRDYGFGDDCFLAADGREITFPMFYRTAGAGAEVDEDTVARFLSNVAGDPLPAEEGEA